MGARQKHLYAVRDGKKVTNVTLRDPLKDLFIPFNKDNLYEIINSHIQSVYTKRERDGMHTRPSSFFFSQFREQKGLGIIILREGGNSFFHASELFLQAEM